MSATLTQTSGPRPEWLKTLLRKYRTGESHAFLLSGTGIKDMDAMGLDVHANLYHVFGNKFVPEKPSGIDFDIIVRYDRFKGFSFMGPEKKRAEDREKFKGIVRKQESSSPQMPSGGSAIMRGGPISSMAGGSTEGDILERSKTPEQAFSLINNALNQSDIRLCVIFDEFQTVAPRGQWDTIGNMFTTCILGLRSWGLDLENIGGHGKKFRNTKGGHLIIGICDDKSDINSVLSRGVTQSGWTPINVGFPSASEREHFIRNQVLTDEYISQIEIDFGSNVAQEEYVSWLAGATGGLSIRQIEVVRLTGERNSILTRDMVSKIINDAIAEQFGGQGGADYLNVINPTLGLRDYGFPEYLIEYFEWFLRQFRAGKLRNANILEAGPPGTGKSLLAYALAYELGYKCVYWSPALTQSKWVGDSEKQLQGVLDWVEANLPCMVFIDEIDVALTSRDGGSVDTSGVGSKMLSILMPWLERDEIKGKLLLVGATNRADNIDSAMRRRLQTVVPMLPPMLSEDRKAVLINVLMREQGVPENKIVIPDDVVSDAATRWYTQAQLSVLAEKAASIASRNEADFNENVAEYLLRAVKAYRVDTAKTEALSYLAATQASDLDLLPPGFEVRKQAEVKELLKDVEDEDFSPSKRSVR